MQSPNGRRCFSMVLLTAGVALCAAPAAAQERAATLARLEVALWPEFDRPAVLVMYRAHLPGEAKLPAVVDLPLPAAAGEPHAVAERGSDGGLYVAPYTRTVKGEWASVAVTTHALDLQLEYYLPLSTSAPQRRFAFAWPGGIAVSELVVDVQKPATATDMKLEPAGGETSVHPDGLTYERVRLGGIPARGRARVAVSYTKPDATLTSPPDQAQAGAAPSAPSGMPAASAEAPPAAPPVATTPARAEPASRDPMVWIVVAAIAIVFFVAGFLVSRGGRPK